MSDATAVENAGSQAGEETLLDRYLPVYHVTRREHLVVDADMATTWSALLDLDLLRVRSPLVDAALWLRALPDRIAARFGRHPATAPPTSLRPGSEEVVEGWLGLGQREGHEVAFGAAGVFWTPDITWCDVGSPDDFAAWDRPGTGRIAAAFQLRPYGAGRTLATYEARTVVDDAPSRRRFLAYWRIVSPFVGIIMRAALRTLRRDAEEARTPTR